REIWAESDTGTGDVCVRWNAVDHPNRMGYVLETLENGVVIGTQFLKDTTWKDSLSAYWEGLPLLGPWPSRERVYRVRTRALNGGGDSRSVAKTLVAKAPEWTRRIDSLGMVMTTDTTKEISRFQWKPFRHPRVLEWRMQRLADGVEDCSGNPVGGAWSDSACKSATVVVIDSTIAGSPNASKVFQQKQPLLTYRLEAERRSGQPEVLFSQDKQTKVTPWLEWERVENPGFKGWKWIWGSGGRLNIARAGGSWEEVPFDCAMPQWLVLQNSVWSICSERSTNLSSFTLDGKGRWNKRTYLTDEIAYLVGGVEVDSGRPLIFGSKALHGRIRFGQIDSDRISFSDTVYPRVDMEFVEEFAEPKITPIEGWGIYLGLIPMYGQSDKILVSRLPSDGSYRRKEWIYSRSTYAGYWYGLGADSFLWLYHSSALGKSMNIYQFWDGDGYVVPEAPVTTNYSNSDWTMIDGEIYVMSWDDSSNEVFWKAKRNFPSNH
ncbi:MAG TPA: hypothetical protein PKY05_16635, partial [Fibrobacteria bacterium]|nr:hypothetical protein [Fibrobacteria bacterium]